ncbi:MAG: helix-turn-helix transcriptional regulator [Myxococcales bacterium]|nr:helix-turn-helix transcriptional regulator [Myxococcales bacterium]
MQLLVDEGLEALTTHRLARELDWAVGALYRYFESKDALFAALVQDVIESYGMAIRETRPIVNTLVADRSNAVGALFRIVVIGPVFRARYLASPPRTHLMNLMLVDPRTILPEPIGKQVSDATVLVLQELGERIAAAQVLGSLRDGSVPHRTVLFWSAIHGVMLRQRQARFEPEMMDTDRLMAEMVKTLLLGWGAPSDQLEEAIELLQIFEAAPPHIRKKV